MNRGYCHMYGLLELSWDELSWVEFIVRPTVSRSIRFGIALPFGAHDHILSLSFLWWKLFVVLPVGRPLWREDGSITYSAVADWSGHWGPITIHYLLIWNCVPSSSPLTSRRDSGGGILTRLHTGCGLVIGSTKVLQDVTTNKDCARTVLHTLLTAESTNQLLTHNNY
jgi:hypothetical protein